MRPLDTGGKRLEECDVEGKRGPIDHCLEAGECMNDPSVALWMPMATRTRHWCEHWNRRRGVGLEKNYSEA